eukprot:311127-Chlamydomonas_euryale.AAC.1
MRGVERATRQEGTRAKRVGGMRCTGRLERAGKGLSRLSKRVTPDPTLSCDDMARLSPQHCLAMTWHAYPPHT